MKNRMKSLLALIIAPQPSHAGDAVMQKHVVTKTTMRAAYRTFAVAALMGCAFLSPADAGTIFSPSNGTYIFLPSEPVAGGVPNALPFTDTFDQYPMPYWLISPTNGWVAAPGDLSQTRLASEMPVAPGDASLFSGNILSLATEGQTLYNVTTGRAQNVWIDMSALLVPSEDPPRGALGTQLGVFLDVDNRFAVYCGLTNGYNSSDIQFPMWTGQKIRLTLQLAYADTLSSPFFRVYVDQAAVNWSLGYRLPGVVSTNGGEWLPCATTNRAFNGLGFMGCASIDALKISDTYVGTNAPVQTGIAQAVAISWLSDYGRKYQVETCDNLASNVWQPFGAPVIGDGTTNTVFEAIGSTSRKFYRVTPVQ